MRIESTDASFSGTITVRGTEFGSREIQNNTAAVKTEIKEVRQESKDIKNLLQLSDYERKVLPVSDKLVIDAIEKANRAITGTNRRFEFSIHEKTKDVMVKVIDTDTNTIVREIPPEKILDMVAKLWEMAGLIVDERR